MRHRAVDRNIEELTRADSRRAVDAADKCRSCSVSCRVHVVSPPRSEVRNESPFRRPNYSARLSCYQRLMIYLRQNCRLDKLRVNKIRHD